ncbi:hypothetical protein ACQP00_20690 [Dactylosporangium sp. CS-047395]|uniref:hypothetical protein n=1 Tax=Dactylosporangium sp. CS-047395 TaxID=3239936 RepID=UPI003D8FD754
MVIEAGTNLRGYMVTVVGRAVEGNRLSDLPEALHLGVELELSEEKVLLHVPVQAPNGAVALSTGRSIAEDFFRVLGSSHSAYLIDLEDERDKITRTDAVYVSEGPVPEADVAEGGITEHGLQWLDPEGEARRAGRVFRIRAAGYVTHPVTADARRFGGRERWSPRLRSGLSLYWAAQCSIDHQVRFVLGVATLEILAERNAEKLLAIRLDGPRRKALRRSLQAALKSFEELTTEDIARLLQRLMDTQAFGATPALTHYLNHLIPDGSGDLAGGVTEDEIRSWTQGRGSYLHAGPPDQSDVASLNRLNLFVGEALRRELDQVVRQSNGLEPSAELGSTEQWVQDVTPQVSKAASSSDAAAGAPAV